MHCKSIHLNDSIYFNHHSKLYVVAFSLSTVTKHVCYNRIADYIEFCIIFVN